MHAPTIFYWVETLKLKVFRSAECEDADTHSLFVQYTVDGTNISADFQRYDDRKWLSLYFPHELPNYTLSLSSLSLCLYTG
jgi:hypothetical protein